MHDRAKHVYSEAKRVLGFREVCERRPGNAIVVRIVKFYYYGKMLRTALTPIVVTASVGMMSFKAVNEPCYRVKK